MLLEDFDQIPGYQLRTINDILKKDYGVTINYDVSLKDLHLLEKQVLEDSDQLRLTEIELHRSPGLSKNLLILEGIKILILEKETSGIKYDSLYGEILNTLVEYVAESIINEGKINIEGAMGVYKQVEYNKYDINEIQTILESFFDDDDVIEEITGPVRGWGIDKEDKNAADEEYKKRYGDSELDDFDWENGDRPGPIERQESRKYKPGMINKLRRILGRNKT